jgi:hypothetical protein
LSITCHNSQEQARKEVEGIYLISLSKPLTDSCLLFIRHLCRLDDIIKKLHNSTNTFDYNTTQSEFSRLWNHLHYSPGPELWRDKGLLLLHETSPFSGSSKTYFFKLHY